MIVDGDCHISSRNFDSLAITRGARVPAKITRPYGQRFAMVAVCL